MCTFYIIMQTCFCTHAYAYFFSFSVRYCYCNFWGPGPAKAGKRCSTALAGAAPYTGARFPVFSVVFNLECKHLNLF